MCNGTGQVHDAKSAPGLIDKIRAAEHVIADKDYDSEAIREHIRQAGANPVIPRKSNSRKPSPEFYAHLYKLRHLVENLFAKLKHFRPAQAVDLAQEANNMLAQPTVPQ